MRLKYLTTVTDLMQHPLCCVDLKFSSIYYDRILLATSAATLRCFVNFIECTVKMLKVSKANEPAYNIS